MKDEISFAEIVKATNEGRAAQRAAEAKQILSEKYGEIYRIVVGLCDDKTHQNLASGNEKIKIVENDELRKKIQQKFDEVNKDKNSNLKFGDLINPKGVGIVGSVFKRLSHHEDEVHTQKIAKDCFEYSISPVAFKRICASCGIKIPNELKAVRAGTLVERGQIYTGEKQK